MQQPTAPDYNHCHGCSLCLLACPMWRAHRDVRYSPQGFAKAMQAGATASDLREQLSCCIMCGACDVMCPEHIDLTGMVNKACKQAELPTLMLEDEYPAYEMSQNPIVQAQINAFDLYIIDAAPFHAHHAERVQHYDDLRHHTGCSMNLDLNRMAIPSGAASVSASMAKFDVDMQLEWLMKGHDFKRIIVENKHDKIALAEATTQAVIHISALMET